MNHIISTDKLSFRYNKKTVVKEIDLNVPEGSIYGFLGPNGAGKSTTIRLLLGLLKPNEGSVKLFNSSIKQDRKKVLSDVGSMIEGPSFYEHLSAYDNLKIHSLYRSLPARKIMDVLEIVQLADSSHKKVKEFSMGMKQRLSIAAALIHDPRVLILDEPTNGLDPQGIQSMRRLIVNLNKNYGKTIFISSHLLSEIELMCDYIGIIKNGQLIYQDTIQALKSIQHNSRIIMEGVDPDSYAEFSKLSIADNIEYLAAENQLEIALKENVSLRELVETLKNSTIVYEQLYKRQDKLEDLFINLTE